MAFRPWDHPVMHTGGKPRWALHGLAVLLILMAVTGAVVQYASASLGHWLVGGAVIGGVILAAARRRKG
jgi:hypothetical protein